MIDHCAPPFHSARSTLFCKGKHCLLKVLQLSLSIYALSLSLFPHPCPFRAGCCADAERREREQNRPALVAGFKATPKPCFAMYNVLDAPLFITFLFFSLSLSLSRSIEEPLSAGQKQRLPWLGRHQRFLKPSMLA